LSCVPFFFMALVILAVTWPFDRNRVVLHLFTCAWAQLYFRMNVMWRMRVAGREKLPWRGAAVLVANHESLGDILVLFGLFRPFKWVSKRSVFSVPFLGWNMWLNGYVGVVRGDRESVIRMLRECEAWLDRGMPVLLFPEGTRSPDGQVKAFKDGAFVLATKKGCPVIPIVLTGTSRALPKHGFVIRDHVDCRVQVLDPVDPAPFGGDVAALREHVRGLMIAEKDRMEGRVPAHGSARLEQRLG
ncbi:MAG TPA: lysophospholipid acyltransferase family protein, partial [Myxococcaceae bacterium]|nr:lysophospholipid acyltransferase family protein [Myxococcaceae bacterium]